MRQFTTPDQTAKLIELGFEKPCSIASVEPIYGMGGISVAKAYTIGELIEILGYDLYDIHYSGFSWEVKSERECVISDTLIDALYNMIVRLKEDGVI